MTLAEIKWESLGSEYIYQMSDLSLKTFKTKSFFTESSENLKRKKRDKIIGIDPGLNLGIAIIASDHISCLEVRLPGKGEQEAAVAAFEYGQFLATIVGGGTARVVMENAAFGKIPGQTLLEAVRTGIYLGMYDSLGDEPLTYERVPPMTARKDVLGHGYLKMSEVILDPFNANAADAFAIALWGAGYRYSE